MCLSPAWPDSSYRGAWWHDGIHAHRIRFIVLRRPGIAGKTPHRRIRGEDHRVLLHRRRVNHLAFLDRIYFAGVFAQSGGSSSPSSLFASNNNASPFCDNDWPSRRLDRSNQGNAADGKIQQVQDFSARIDVGRTDIGQVDSLMEGLISPNRSLLAMPFCPLVAVDSGDG